ncbi:hypothetical protein QCD60_19515 [Pokkaliibacter sp. MBI-7]|uniref:hypothetical protein n=1 Tax=Pokkaliibacter sp. MBI-7 TaxID=3040600 RepID=UPI002447ABDC|nr:hypothetical protein [Pokkaliibacter sp. MBI-7]MDH2434735.1 hypothetical protein [Pokkaliibacter sp. MBI-7]
MGQLPEDPALSGCYQGLVNMAWALLGILNQDQDTFNAGLMGQLAVHYQWALCSGRDEETYICLSHWPWSIWGCSAALSSRYLIC